MNRSIFQSSPFRPAYGLQPIRQQATMGQSIFDELGGDVTAINTELDSWIKQLPVDVAGHFSQRRDACLAKPIISQYKCLYDLFQDIKKAVEGKNQTPPVVPPPSPAPSSGLPILPIAIGAVALAGVLYFAFGRN
jgi:hypothetical protein